MYTDIKVGFTCNNNCVHCVVAPIKKDLVARKMIIDSSTEEVKKHIDDAKNRGSDSIVLTGGEVTIRDDFDELVQYVVKKDMKLTIQTNARVLGRQGKLNFLKGLPVITFVVAIHGHNEIIHDTITRVKSSFHQTISAIDSLKKHSNAEIHGKLVISKFNMEYLVKTTEFLENLGVKKLTIAFPHAEDFPRKAFKAVVPRYRELKSLIGDIIDYGCSHGMNVLFETVPYCIVPDRQNYWKYSIDAKYSIYGAINPGFIQSTGDPEIRDWEKLRNAIKHKSQRCVECVFDKVCEGPWREYVDAFGDKELVPITDTNIVDRI